MTLLIIITVVGLVAYYKLVGFNIGCIIGGIIGALIGSNLGIAGSGTATNGWILFGAIGFIVGGLVVDKFLNQEK